MKQTKTRLGPGGRVVIPAEYRNELGLETGDEVTIVLDENGLHVWTLKERLRRIRAIAARHVPAGTLVSDELLADRRREAAGE